MDASSKTNMAQGSMDMKQTQHTTIDNKQYGSIMYSTDQKQYMGTV